MMESMRHHTKAFPAGVAMSTMLHVVVVVYVVFWISRPMPKVERPTDLSKAIPILMQQIRPEPPKPEPPKPIPKEPPKPIPTPETIETTAAQQAIETPAVKPPPPPVDQEKYEEPPPPAGAPYSSLLRGVIEREKRYPREALMSGDQGMAMVKFTINRYGTILLYTIEKRTSSSSLDAEVKRMMRRIKFPAPPETEKPGQERLEYTIPIEFKLTD